MENGDVIAVIQEMDHPVFKRKGVDLFVKKKISLSDALCGCTFYIEHLDGRKLAISNPPGQVLFPGMLILNRVAYCILFILNSFIYFFFLSLSQGCIKGLSGEGMMSYRHHTKGNLYFEFEIDFPPENFITEDEKFAVSVLERFGGEREKERMISILLHIRN